MHKMGGFTLTELMIVLFIFGLTATLVIGQFPGRSASDKGSKVFAAMTFAAAQSQQTRTLFRLQAGRQGWTLMFLEPGGREPSRWPGHGWTLSRRFGQGTFEAGHVPVLTFPGATPVREGEIFFMPDGQVTPFVFHLLDNGLPRMRIALIEGEIREVVL